MEATHPNNHKMAKAYQDVMKWKSSAPNFTWPSSSHLSLFGEAAALEFFFSTGSMQSNMFLTVPPWSV